MLIAVPMKVAKSDSTISPLFGHAKYFAFIQGDRIEIEANPVEGGQKVVQWLLEKGVDVVLTQHIGLHPFVLLAQQGVKIYYPGEGRIELTEAIEAFKKRKLEPITEANIEKFARHKEHHR